MRYLQILFFLLINLITVQSQVTSLPFCEDFELGVLNNSYWTATPGVPNGLVEVANQISTASIPYAGSFGVALGKSSTGDAVENFLDLHVDLSAYEGEELTLSFWIKDNTDENFSDGIKISDDGGASWQNGQALFAIPISPESMLPNNTYGRYLPYDLDCLIDSFDLDYTNQFIIRFQQRGSADFNTSGAEDGLMFDDICINIENPVIPVSTFPHCEGFEANNGAIPSAWRIVNPFKHGQTIDQPIFTRFWSVRPLDGLGFNSNYGLRMGKWRSDEGENVNAIDLHLDLSAQEGNELTLSFWLKDIWDDNDAYDGIYLSDDNGDTFTEVAIQFLPESMNPNDVYGQYLPYDFDELIDSFNLDYTNQFVIRFQQQGDADFNTSGAEDGLIFDDICINIEAPIIPVSTFPYCEGFEANDGAIPPAWRIANPFEEGQTIDEPIFTRFWSVIPLDGLGFNSSYGLRMGKWRSEEGENVNAIDLHLDLSAQAGNELTLSFWLKDIWDDNDAFDGIYLSDDNGETFTEIAIQFLPESMNPNDVYGQYLPYDLDELIATYTLDYTSQFVIRFQQQGDADFNTSGAEDGLIFDDICINIEKSIVYHSIPFFDDFEADTVSCSWRIANAVEEGGTAADGLTRFYRNERVTTNNWPNVNHTPGGAKGHILGKWRSEEGNNVNALDLHLDMTNAISCDDVSLNFWLLDFFDENDESDKVFFSNNGGLDFYPLFQFMPESYPNNVYQEYTLDLDALVLDSLGLSFTDSCIIRFQQYDNADFNTSGDEDGFYLDDISVFTATNTLSESVTICAGESYNGYTQNGTYTDTLSSNTGCDTIYTLDLMVGTAITVFNEDIQADLNNTSTGEGSITVNMDGGTEPYTYNWDIGGTTNTSSNLTSGDYNLTVTDNAGCSYTFTFTVPLDIVESLFTIVENDVLHIYPNPAKSQVHIEWPEQMTGEVSLYFINPLGQEVITKEIQISGNSSPVSIEDLSVGVWLVRIVTEKGEAFGKFIKI